MKLGKREKVKGRRRSTEILQLILVIGRYSLKTKKLTGETSQLFLFQPGVEHFPGFSTWNKFHNPLFERLTMNFMGFLSHHSGYE
jgi:hypothetical protein